MFIEYMICGGHSIIYTSKIDWEGCDGIPRRPSENTFMIPPAIGVWE